MGRFLDRSEINTTLDRRHVADIMLLLAPHKTPLFALMKKGKGRPKNSVLEWPFETEAAPVTTPVADATDVTENDFENFETNYGMLAGRPHKTRVAIGVGEVAEATTEQYGGKGRLFAKTRAKALRKLKANIEAIVLGLQDSAISVSSNKTTYTTRGIGCWAGLTTVTDTLTIAAAAACPSGSRINLATAAYSTLTEEQVRDMLQSIFDASNEEAEGMLGLCVSAIKRVFADFMKSGSTASSTHPLRRFNQNGGDKEIMLRVDRYIGDFGDINLRTHTTSFLPQSASASAKSVGMYVLDPDALQAEIVVPIEFKELEDRGGGPRGFCSTTFVNEVLNPLRIGVVHKTNAP